MFRTCHSTHSHSLSSSYCRIIATHNILTMHLFRFRRSLFLFFHRLFICSLFPSFTFLAHHRQSLNASSSFSTLFSSGTHEVVLTPHHHTLTHTHTNDKITLETSCSSAPGLTMPNGLLLFRLHTLERFNSVQCTHKQRERGRGGAEHMLGVWLADG